MAVKLSAIDTTTALIEALRARHDPKKGNLREWAFFEQVRSSAWYARTADALALNLWKSRGHTLHGFEVKATRTDWLKELHSPDKAETIARFCDYWWIVTVPGIIEAGELPGGWGLMLLRGSRLRVETQAVRVEPVPLSGEFIVEMIRGLHRETSLESVKAVARAEGRDEGRAYGKQDLRNAKESNRLLEERIRTFEKAAGIRIQDWNHNAEQIGNAVRIVLSGDDREAQTRSHLEQLEKQARRIADSIAQELNSD